MENLAYKLEEKYEKAETLENTSDKIIDNYSRAETAKMFGFIISYGIIFLAVGTVYVNFIMAKTEYNMRMAKYKTQKNQLMLELNKIKADTDSKVDFGRVETAAVQKLDMEIAEEIKYIKISK